MSRRFDISKAVQKAAESKTPDVVPTNRFGRTANLLKTVPTGFHERSDEATEDVGSSVDLYVGNEPRAIHEVVSIDLIDDNPYNARNIYKPDIVNSLSNSIKRNGQAVPGLAVKNGNRRTLVAGHYRKRALILAGINKMSLMTYESLSNQQMYEFSYRENAEHSAQLPIDNAISWKKLLDDGVFSNQQDIAETIGMSKANVYKTLAILDLEPSVLETIKLDPEPFGLSLLYELTLLQKLVSVHELERVTQEVLAGRMGRKEVADYRVRIQNQGEQPAQRQRNQTSRQWRIFNGGTKVGHIKEWDSGKVLVEVTLDDAQEKARFIHEMQERFKVN